MSIDRMFFPLQPIISKFYFRSLKNGSQSLGTWQMNVNNTKVYIISLKNHIIMHFVS